MNAVHFYQNRQLELYAARNANRLTLRQLVFFGRSMNEERLIKSANYVRTELPVRIAHRLRDLQALPYVVVTNESVAKVYELYWSAFEKLRRYPAITTLAENEAFCSFLRGILNEHLPVIPLLSLGLSLSSPHLAPDYLDSFMRRMLVSRISRRVLAEHHIALTESLVEQRHRIKSRNKAHGDVGIIYTDLRPKESIERCVRLLHAGPNRLVPGLSDQAELTPPEVIIDGDADTRFAYIREHLDYIIFELLKNAMKATATRHRSQGGTGAVPVVRATIVAGPNEVNLRISDQGGGILSPYITSTSDLFSFSHVRNAARMEVDRLGALRLVSASQHGLSATVGEQVGERDTEKKIAPMGMGIGLPMSRIFARYFGGSLELVSLDGWGTDVYLRLPKLGTNLEGLEV
ncbi:alpha-ketoacid dehydrogenase kinase N-terminal domain-containing protein [Sistotremastrum niveocremeum HHB9708]|uniref:Protein-serine/threonine kinase n=1 Tax=Sistotremastrum niveocremeum HHB9708 TaxID=1314777 RepID=A0A164ZF95_9AGAM|nr:alpha-ketoacid dehydrogenase kinase N-terminal domain-containing protein [Sistotremastrum niveocremeum HHB9708]